ncbi:site-specific DNA-methyltransferase [Mobiluncus curtisii]|uniref:DNA (Cytosine-5-)-methyltransferase n=1 Tax=Mobiluncus curtisii ATCC 51333 TaxID=887326 RepID=E6LY41_9ACTO|nr:site-specific DNA-methyltransferase [Mobiluncus curtisii]EFU80558.1 DNA (cytosine-5-)-methyltransferase [Mobiluncus curtisii ATCC 51333]
MPELNWVGKNKVINHHLDVPYRVLERQYSFDTDGQHKVDNGSNNMIIHGDNLEALKSLLPRYDGQVDVIYIDPPYNTGNEGWVYNDAVNDPQIKKWLGEVVGKEGEDLSRHDKWLCMMYPRLRLLQRLLAPTGAIFISIDDNEAANLRLIGNEIFGARCFVADISWQRTYSTRNDSKGIPAEVEHLLVFSKQPDWQPNKLERTAEMDSKYKNPDNDRSPWRTDNAFAPGARTHQGMVYAIQHPFTGELLYPAINNCWRYQQDEMFSIMSGWTDYELVDLYDEAERAKVCGVKAEEVREGVKAIMLAKPLEQARLDAQAVLARGQWPRFFFTKNGEGGIARKTYLDSVGGLLPTNYWSHVEAGHTDEAKKEIQELFDGAVAFDTPKPTRLIERVLKVASSPHSIVLDSFAGSGTTAHAVLSLNKKDGGNRQFILVELGDYADSVTAERVKRVARGYTATKSVKTTLYDEKLTTAMLKKGEKVFAEAKAIADGAKDQYEKVTGPSVKDGQLQVVAQTSAKEDVPGLGGDFSFYELGPELIAEGNLNPDVPVAQVRDYIWFTETRRAIPDDSSSNPYYLGSANGAVYYFIYEPDAVTVLDRAFLATMDPNHRGESYIVYADLCELSAEEMTKLGIVFKKIPRDITRL